MQFKIIRHEDLKYKIDHEFWTRAFHYGAREFGFDHFHSMVTCMFTPYIKSKIEPQTLGWTDYSDGEVIISIAMTAQPVKTFFHELTHAKQFLNRELVTTQRSTKWKGKRWGRQQYSFAPWEEEANAAEKRLYDGFKQSEVMRQMRRPGANAYTIAVPYVSQDEIWAITSQLNETPAIASSLTPDPETFIQQFATALEGHTEAFKAEVVRGLYARLCSEPPEQAA